MPILKKNIFFFIFISHLHSTKNNNSINNINKNSLWFKMRNHLVDKNELDNLDKILYAFVELKDNRNINENINYILEEKIPINVYGFRKILEERLLSCKDGNLKEEFLKKILVNYMNNKDNYKPITRDLKMLFILSYLAKKNLIKFPLYKFIYGLLLNLVYEHNHLPFQMLNSLHTLHNISLERRFIFMIEILNLDGANSIGKLSKNTSIHKIINRIKLLEENKLDFFENIFELYWYLNKNYEKLDLINIANIIRHNKHLIKNSTEICSQLKKNIIYMILKILPHLIINKYEYIEDLLDIKLVNNKEEAYSTLSYANGIYNFYKKKYEKAYENFVNGFENLKKHSDNIYEESKYRFWIANSLLILGKKEKAAIMYKKVAFLNINYYSNISYVLINQRPLIKSIYHLKEDKKTSPYDWYFRGLTTLAKGNEFILTLGFINNINLDALKIISQEMLLMLKSLKELKNQSFIVLLTSKIYEYTGMIFVENYPLIEPMKNFSLNKSILLSSILKRETFFRTDPLISHKGARGPMQIMTATAKTLCDRHNINYCNENLLHNPAYNLKIALKCVDELLRLFKSSLFLAIPAYNIGSPTVQKWWKSLKEDLDMENFLHMFLFVELIPYEVTKGYTKDILNNYILFWFINHSGELDIKNMLKFQDN